MTLLRSKGDAQMEAQRYAAQQAARPAFNTLRPSERAAELIARMEVAKMHKNRADWDEAKAELMTLVNEL